MRLVKKITEIYSDDNGEEDDLAAVDGVVIDDTGALGDSDPGDEDEGPADEDEPEEPRLSRSRSLMPKPKRRGR